ncbi:HEAT repeat domain-containing protein [Streptomyces sp. NPDC014894]|uniref:HEAT repeat domain-containing protein n=1 Tax=Streptomyces sp. NPDC014894 TaxID=3364931 RepID=UPI0037012D6E
MPHTKQRIVLHRQVTPDDIQDVAWDLDWNAIEVGIRDSGSLVDVWRTNDGETDIRFVQDFPIGTCYLLVSGRGVESVTENIRSRAFTWTFTEALSFTRRAAGRDDTLAGIYAVALSADSTDRDAAVELLHSMTRSPDPGIRQAVVIATGYLGWPELIDLVEEIHRTDAVYEVRANAGVLLDGLRRHDTSTDEG